MIIKHLCKHSGGSLRLFSVFSILLLFLAIYPTSQWCFKTSFNQPQEATTIDYSYDNTLIAVASTPQKSVYVYSSLNYNVLFTYTNSANPPQIAKFSKDGKYLGIGLNNGTVILVNGNEPFSSSTVLQYNMNSSSTITGLDFSVSGKILICYASNYRVYVLPSTTVFTPASGVNAGGNILSCKFSALDEIVLIDNNKKITALYINYTSIQFQFTQPNNFNSFDVRQTTASPQKMVGANGDNNIYTHLMNSNSSASTNAFGGTASAACYNKDGSYYAIAGTGKYVWIFADNDTKTDVYSNSVGSLKSCVFSQNGEYLLVGSTTPNGTIYVYKKNCFTCLIGFYENNANTCLKCTTTANMTNCASCVDAITCSACYQGFYLNTTTHLCRSCNILEGCSTCNSSLVCIECNVGYYLTGSNICSQCSTGCLSCLTSSSCLICNLAYYLSGPTCRICTQSLTGCLRCNSSSSCIQCMQGYYQVSNSGCSLCNVNCLTCQSSSSNCSSCVRGYYLNVNICTLCMTYCHECYNNTYCIDCKVGTYRNSTGSCLLCTTPCAACNTTTTTCYACIEGYYYVSSNNTCQVCGNNCSTCTTITNCSTCYVGFYLVTASNTCTECKPTYSKCATCSSTLCISCDIGYYLNATSLCTPCNNNNQMYACLSCNTSTNCQACAVGFYLTAGTGNSSCAICGVGCETCTQSSVNCTNCIVGYYLSSITCLTCINNCQSCMNSTSCISCNMQYYLLANVTCDLCTNTINGCLSCTNSSYCQTCKLGMYLSSTNNQCISCAFPCLTCNNITACYSCTLGYYLTSSTLPATCVKCQETCSSCLSSSNCLTCGVMYYLNSTLVSNQCLKCTSLFVGCQLCSNTTCYSCVKGYYLNASNKCQLCLTSIASCLQCANSTSCKYCSEGFYLAVGNASCISCSVSIVGCDICESGVNCTNCKLGFYFQSSNSSCTTCPNKCHSCSSSSTCTTCSLSYFSNGSDCLPCDTYLTSCELCSSTTICLRCSNGYYLNVPTNTSCVYCRTSLSGCYSCNASNICVECQSGYYLTTTNTCNPCKNSISGCLICNSSIICTACDSGYYLTGNTCILCSSTMLACIYCSNGSYCLSCQTGYYLNPSNNTCRTCSAAISGCIYCSNNGTVTICQLCTTGYYLYLNVTSNVTSCVVCSGQSCALCQQNDSTKCINCNSKYYLETVNSTCILCPQQACLECTSNSTCISCQVGYYLLSTTHSCYLCSTSINGCTKCANITTCYQCQQLYYLHPTTKICVACGNTIAGCLFCDVTLANAIQCLICDSAYYLNTTTYLCTKCSAISGCLLCSNSTSCLQCQIQFFLSNNTCIECSSQMQNCTTCMSNLTCESCDTGYVLNTTFLCEAMKLGTGSTAVDKVTDLLFKTYFINSSCLKHILSTRGMSYKQVSNISWSNNVKIYLENKPSSVLLTINLVQWGTNGNTLIFYTNNPVNTTVSNIPLIPNSTKTTRLLVGLSTSQLANSLTSFSLTQSILAQILPQYTHEGDLTLGYSLSNPQFYQSILSNTSKYYYYLFGLIMTIALFLIFLIKASCVMPYSPAQGQIIPHILSLKVIPLLLYPVYGEYMNYAYGFMTADLPWLNQYFGSLISDHTDKTPLGYSLYYTNMNIASMYLLALGVVFICMGVASIVLYRNRKINRRQSEGNFMTNQQKRNHIKTQEQSKQKYLIQNKYESMLQFFFNFFILGLVFASSSSLQGSISNSKNLISSNGVFYIIGIMIYILLLMYICWVAYNKGFSCSLFKIRIFLKCTVLSYGHYSPIYIITSCILLDCIFIILEYVLRWNKPISMLSTLSSKALNQQNIELYCHEMLGQLVCPKIWVVNNILVNLALAFFFYVGDSLIIIYVVSAIVLFVFVAEIYVLYREYHYKKDILKMIILEKQMLHGKNTQKTAWKINLENYELEKEENTMEKKQKFSEGLFMKINSEIEIEEDEMNNNSNGLSNSKGMVDGSKRRNRRFFNEKKQKNSEFNNTKKSFLQVNNRNAVIKEESSISEISNDEIRFYGKQK